MSSFSTRPEKLISTIDSDRPARIPGRVTL
jgi:hypothetical protein